MEQDLLAAIASVEKFAGADLTRRLAIIEESLRNMTISDWSLFLAESGVDSSVLSGAGLLKRIPGQVNVVVHAAGILKALPHLLVPEERIEYVSLGAGNTGRRFDLETSHRVAEFKFIRWQGGAEVIRQNALFKDFYLLAEYPTPKRKYLYVLGTGHALRFFCGKRSLSSVLSRHVRLQAEFSTTFGDRFRTVCEYYSFRRDLVTIEDISSLVPELVRFSEDAATEVV